MNVLTPPAALFEVIVAVLTFLGHDFGAQVPPTWVPGPSLTLEKLCFSLVFHTFQEIATFAAKSSKRPKNECPDPSGGPVRLTPLGHDFVAQVAPTWALGPSPTLQKPLFSLFSIHFKK